MLNAEVFVTNEDQYYYGTRYLKKTDTQGDMFRYSLLTEQKYVYGQVINNLIATQGTATIKSNWNLEWHRGDFVVLNDGTRWKVIEYVPYTQNVNPQTNYWFKQNLSTDFVLNMIKVDNVGELQ